MINRILKWFKTPAKITFDCDICGEKCDWLVYLGKKKEHYYLDFLCSDCKAHHYISIDTLKKKPKLSGRRH